MDKRSDFFRIPVKNRLDKETAVPVIRVVCECGSEVSRADQDQALDPVHPEDLPDLLVQIVDLIAKGVDGIHLYTMNSPYVAEKITRAVENLL